jgi:hypothetical protein
LISTCLSNQVPCPYPEKPPPIARPPAKERLDIQPALPRIAASSLDDRLSRH